MPDLTSDSVIITGGINTKQVVSRYDRQGYLQDLPHLIEGRFLHACGSYLRNDGNQVKQLGFVQTYDRSEEHL